MLLEETELMPELDRDEILQNAKPFDHLKRLGEFRRRFPAATAEGHCLAVACAAEVLAVKLEEKGQLERTEVETAVWGSLIDDDKKGQETANLSFKDLLVLQTDGFPGLAAGKILDKIVHLAAGITSTTIPFPGAEPLTVYLTPWEKMVVSDFRTRYPRLWQEGLGFDSNNKVTAVYNIAAADKSLRWIRSYVFWHTAVFNGVCWELQHIINPENTEKSEYFVKNLVNNQLVS